MVIDKEQLQEELKIAKQIERQKDDKPVVPLAGIVYGDTIYWGTIIGTVLTLLGQVISFVGAKNYVAASYVMSSLWQGSRTDDLWSPVGGPPNGHWYLDQMYNGDGLTMFGIAMGVFSVTPAIFGAAYVLFREKKRLFGSLAVIAALISIYAMLP